MVKLNKNQVLFVAVYNDGTQKSIIGLKWTPFSGIDLVIHKDREDKLWTVSEPITGRSVENALAAKTILQAKLNVENFIKQKGVEEVQRVISMYKKKGGNDDREL